jgi:hypothetical protein
VTGILHLLASVQNIRVVHNFGSFADAAKSSYSNVVFPSMHIVHHLGKRICFLVVYFVSV